MRSVFTRKYTSGLYRQQLELIVKKTEKLNILWNRLNMESNKFKQVLSDPHCYTKPQYRQAIKHLPWIVKKKKIIQQELGVWNNRARLLKQRAK